MPVSGARLLHHPLTNPEIVNISTSSDAEEDRVGEKENPPSTDPAAIHTAKKLKKGGSSAAKKNVLEDEFDHSKQSMAVPTVEDTPDCLTTLLGPSCGTGLEGNSTEAQVPKSASSPKGNPARGWLWHKEVYLESRLQIMQNFVIQTQENSTAYCTCVA